MNGVIEDNLIPHFVEDGVKEEDLIKNHPAIGVRDHQVVVFKNGIPIMYGGGDLVTSRRFVP